MIVPIYQIPMKMRGAGKRCWEEVGSWIIQKGTSESNHVLWSSQFPIAFHPVLAYLPSLVSTMFAHGHWEGWGDSSRAVYSLSAMSHFHDSIWPPWDASSPYQTRQHIMLLALLHVFCFRALRMRGVSERPSVAPQTWNRDSRSTTARAKTTQRVYDSFHYQMKT